MEVWYERHVKTWLTKRRSEWDSWFQRRGDA